MSEDGGMVYFIDQLAEGEDREAYRRLLAEYGNLTSDTVKFLWDQWKVTEQTSYKEQKIYPLMVMVLTRHVCEQIDAVGVLAAAGCTEPCKPHLRSTFEAMLGIEYILEADSERRGMAYQLAHAHREVALCMEFDPAEQVGKQLIAELSKDPLWAGMELPPTDAKTLAKWQAMFAKAEWAPLETEWQSKKRRPEWYSLFGGPDNIQNLATHMTHVGMYKFLYRQWSNATHASDCLTKIAGSKTGQVHITTIRNPVGLRSVVRLSVSLCKAVARMILDRWGTTEQKAAADAEYATKIQPRFHGLGEITVNFVD